MGPSCAGAVPGNAAAEFVADSSALQHAQHAGGVADCPWGELQEVAIEMFKLMLATMHDTYAECAAWYECMEKDGAHVEGTSEIDPCGEGAMTHACVVERTQALNVSIAMCAHLLLTDTPTMYRHMLQPPIRAISGVRRVLCANGGILLLSDGTNQVVVTCTWVIFTKNNFILRSALSNILQSFE